MTETQARRFVPGPALPLYLMLREQGYGPLLAVENTLIVVQRSLDTFRANRNRAPEMQRR